MPRLPHKIISIGNHFSYKSLFIILFFLLIGIVALFKFYPQNKISAAWWNDGWGYRKAVSITNSSSTITNQYVKITLDTSALITAGKIQNNCNDIRVTNINGKLLTHFIDGDTEYDCNDTDTSIYALVDSIPSNGTTIYIYYGNPSAENNEPVLGSSNYPAISCRNILEHRSDSNGTGTYYITPTGNLSDKIQVSCDMSYSSGGWILVWHGLPSEAMVRNTSNESVSLSNDIIFNEMRMEGVNLNFNVISSTVETAKLAKSIPQHYYEVDNTSDATNPKVNFYDLDGNQDVLLSNNYFMYGYGNSWRVFYTCINVSGIDYTYLGGYSPTCTPRSSFNTISVSCTGGGNNYCNGNARNTSPKDSGLGLSLYEYQETKVYIRESNITLDVNQSAGSPSTEEQSTAPVAYWKFDEGVGTTAYDSTSNQNNATISGAAWKTEDQCISGKCLNFPSSGSITALSNARLNFSTNSFTISAWTLLRDYTYPKSTFMISKEVNNCYATGNPGFYIGHGYQSNGSVFCINDGTNYINSTLTYDSGYKPADTQNKWTHFEYIFDRTAGKIKVYVNGIKQSSELDISSVTGSVNNSSNLVIGTLHGWMTDGKIDDVKIYPYARSATQIKQDYAAGKAHSSSTKGTSVNLGGSNQSGDFLSNGLVGYWKMDEGVGTTTADSSGNGNTGTLSGATWSSGKFGIGTSFGSVNSNVSLGSSANLNTGNYFTLSGWYKFNSFKSENYFYNRNGQSGTSGFHIVWMAGASSEIRYQYANGSTYNTLNSNSLSWNINQWYFISVVHDLNAKTINFYRDGVNVGTASYTNTALPVSSGTAFLGGYQGDNRFDGSIDDLRIYNRALSPSEVSQLYNWAPGPKAYYNFDEGSGSILNDLSGNNFSGVLNNVSFIPGKYGRAGKFNGSVDSYADINYQAINGLQDFTTSFWMKSSGSADGIISGAGSNSDNELFIAYQQNFDIRTRNVNVDTNISTNDGEWHFISVTRNQSTGNMVLYVDGILKNQGISGTLPLNISSGGFILGQDQDSVGGGFSASQSYDGLLDDLKIYNYIRTQRQIIEDMNAGHPIGGSPVGSQLAYWKFDEGYGSATYDFSSHNYTGTFGTGNSAPTWTNDGKFGKALSFVDGQYIRGLSDILLGLSQITISAWVKPISTTYIFQHGSSYSINGYINYFRVNSTGSMTIDIEDAITTAHFIPSTSTGLVSMNSWSYVSVVIRSNLVDFYVNGKKVYTSSTFNGAYPFLSTSDGYKNIGRYNYNNSAISYSSGIIDEVKIYNSALTDNDILLDYNQGKSIVMGSKGTESDGTTNSFSAAREYCIPGDTSTCNPPIAEWKMDEGVGTTAYDTSGNNLHGILGSGNSSPTWAQGKTGSGLNFDGINDYIQTSSAINLGSSFTIGFWMKPTNLHNYGDPLSAGTGDKYLTFVTYADGHMGYGVGIGTSWGTSINTTAGKFSNNQWYYITGTSNGINTELFVNGISQNTAPNNISINQVINVGARLATGYWFAGAIDQVKIYNYARTPAQISWDYNRGKPIAWWKFDECQGTAIGDWSMNGSTGTLNIGASGTQNSVGTCSVGTSAAWTNGASGKLNSSLSFDGTDDYVSTSITRGYLGSRLSVAVWFKFTGSSGDSYRPIIGGYDSGAGTEFFIGKNSGNTNIGLQDGNYISNMVSGSNAFNGNWHHLVYTYDSGTGKVYLDGSLKNTQAFSKCNDSEYIYIGKEDESGGYFFPGQIDDVQVYNYALTATQVKDVYNNGAVNFSN
ncbi:MAG: DUF2341 domain-containing protein [Candidatus Shapirobacteria bacterium]|nr:DUF2341 domain-containing protein [Candidatus Shapirobacteria bacterium]